MFGHFSPEALQKFQEMQGLTSNQDFSEGVFDFKVCQKPDGKYYGIANDSKCEAPAKEVKKAPDRGFLGLQEGRQINYETARAQGEERKHKDANEKMAKAAKEGKPIDYETALLQKKNKKAEDTNRKEKAKPRPSNGKWSDESMNSIADDINRKVDRVATKARAAVAAGDISYDSAKSSLKQFINTAWNETIKHEGPNSPNKELVRNLAQENLDKLDTYLDKRNDFAEGCAEGERMIFGMCRKIDGSKQKQYPPMSMMPDWTPSKVSATFTMEPP
jgi:hypothetical protein